MVRAGRDPTVVIAPRARSTARLVPASGDLVALAGVRPGVGVVGHTVRRDARRMTDAALVPRGGAALVEGGRGTRGPPFRGGLALQLVPAHRAGVRSLRACSRPWCSRPGVVRPDRCLLAVYIVRRLELAVGSASARLGDGGGFPWWCRWGDPGGGAFLLGDGPGHETRLSSAQRPRNAILARAHRARLAGRSCRTGSGRGRPPDGALRHRVRRVAQCVGGVCVRDDPPWRSSCFALAQGHRARRMAGAPMALGPAYVAWYLGDGAEW